MITTNTYLRFDGNCRAAMTFYGKCLQAEPGFTPFSAVPAEMGAKAKATPDWIIHSELHGGPVILMASDTLPGMTYERGNNFAISISCESLVELERLFASFSENGTVTMPLHIAFWGGHFGMLTDQFGINWMFSFREAGQHG